MDCLFKDGEDTSNLVRVEGIFSNFGFHPDRLENHKHEIVEMLNELPEQFHENTGGGWSFLNACMDKHGNQWTDLHRVMEQLFVLGIGINRVEYVLQRDMWRILPGGMPYCVIFDSDIREGDKQTVQKIE